AALCRTSASRWSAVARTTASRPILLTRCIVIPAMRQSVAPIGGFTLALLPFLSWRRIWYFWLIGDTNPARRTCPGSCSSCSMVRSPIDLDVERPISFSEAAEVLSRLLGVRLGYKKVYIWSRTGFRKVVLEHIRIDQSLFTS